MSTAASAIDPRDLNATTAPNAYRLLWAGFMSILAAGVGFSVRGAILSQWGRDFGFTMTELGTITGGGLTGMGVVIILGSLVAERLGYGKLMLLAFLLHFLSAVITLAAPLAYASGGKPMVYQCLYWGMFVFALGNGLCETVVNPLTATLFPNNRSHFLNILHAGWPAGLVLGGLAAAWMAGTETVAPVDWKIQMSLFLIPVLIYGAMLLGQKFPVSEASEAGVSTGEMLGTLFAPLMLVLLVAHALVGYVELGTDSWISKITGAIMKSPQNGLYLFVYTSLLMFGLRFVAGPIVHKISPLGLLLVSAILGVIGLNMLSRAEGIWMCVIAASVYACGKTFLWPTMLAVASEQYPKGGAISIGAMGAAGMLSAGLLGGPAIGFKQDYNASAELKKNSPAAYERYQAPEENSFLGFKTKGLSGEKVAILEDNAKELKRDIELMEKEKTENKETKRLADWWKDASEHAKEDGDFVKNAGIYGGRKALEWTSLVPAAMAVIYLLLVLYFSARGGYKVVHVAAHGGAEGHAGH